MLNDEINVTVRRSGRKRRADWRETLQLSVRASEARGHSDSVEVSSLRGQPSCKKNKPASTKRKKTVRLPFCSNCGRKHDSEAANFCTKCGRRRSTSTASTTANVEDSDDSDDDSDELPCIVQTINIKINLNLPNLNLNLNLNINGWS